MDWLGKERWREALDNKVMARDPRVTTGRPLCAADPFKKVPDRRVVGGLFRKTRQQGANSIQEWKERTRNVI
jgi:hypothetical protein